MRDHPSARRPSSVLLGMLLGGIGGGVLFTTILAVQSFVQRPVLAEAPLHNLPFAGNAVAQSPDGTDEVVSGTLRSLDLSNKKGMITTDLGRHVTFSIVKPELFTHVSEGQRVTVKLDRKSQAIKVMETAAPELPSSTMPQ